MPSARIRWIGIAVATLALLYASGLRSMFGVLITPLEHEFGYDRAALGTLGAVSLFLYGAIGPFAGRFAARLGTPLILGLGLLALGAGELFASNAHGLIAFYLTIGVVVALGSGAVGMPSATSLAARWFTDKRGLVLGILAAGVSAGQILVIPPAQWLTDHSGWRTSLAVLGVGALLIALPTYLLIRDRGQRGESKLEIEAAKRDGFAIGDAIKTLPFWLLAGSFFVCGYTTAGLVLVHFIPDCIGRGFTGQQASLALGVMGAMNVVGTLGSGWICDRFGRVIPLALFYVFRAVTLVALIFVHEPVGLFLFAAAFGLNYIATVPPTSSLLARIFGARAAGELYGWVFVSHQVGAALGAWVGGVVYTSAHTYAPAYLSAAVLAVLAGVMVIAIRDAPRSRAVVSPLPAGA
jgi:predicted MFS family arabinose efflux permease